MPYSDRYCEYSPLAKGGGGGGVATRRLAATTPVQVNTASTQYFLPSLTG